MPAMLNSPIGHAPHGQGFAIEYASDATERHVTHGRGDEVIDLCGLPHHQPQCRGDGTVYTHELRVPKGAELEFYGFLRVSYEEPPHPEDMGYFHIGRGLVINRDTPIAARYDFGRRTAEQRNFQPVAVDFNLTLWGEVPEGEVFRVQAGLIKDGVTDWMTGYGDTFCGRQGQITATPYRQCDGDGSTYTVRSRTLPGDTLEIAFVRGADRTDAETFRALKRTFHTDSTIAASYRFPGFPSALPTTGAGGAAVNSSPSSVSSAVQGRGGARGGQGTGGVGRAPEAMGQAGGDR